MMLSHRVALKLLDGYRRTSALDHARSISGTSEQMQAVDHASVLSKIFALNNPVLGEVRRRDLVIAPPVMGRARIPQVASKPTAFEEIAPMPAAFGKRQVGGVGEVSISRKSPQGSSERLSAGRRETRSALQAATVRPTASSRADGYLDHAKMTNRPVMRFLEVATKSAASPRKRNELGRTESLARTLQLGKSSTSTSLQSNNKRPKAMGKLPSFKLNSSQSSGATTIASLPAAGTGQVTASLRLNRQLPSLAPLNKAITSVLYGDSRSKVATVATDDGNTWRPLPSLAAVAARASASTAASYPSRVTDYAAGLPTQLRDISLSPLNDSLLASQRLHGQVVPTPSRGDGPAPYPDLPLPQNTPAATASVGGLLDDADHGRASGIPVIVHLTGDVMIDGRRLGRLAASSQARDASLPAQGPSRVNLRAIPIYSGMQIPR